MTELSKNCPACNSVVRPQAVFCHRCGRTLLIAEAADATIRNTQDFSAENNILENEMLMGTPILVKKAAPLDVMEVPENTDGAGTMMKLTENELVNSSNETMENKNTLNTASPSTVPVRSKKRYVSRTEYVWEEKNAPIWRVIAVSLLIFTLVAVLLWLNNFLR